MAATRDDKKPKPRPEPRPATSIPSQGSLFALFNQHQVVAADSLLRLLADWLSTLLTCSVIAIALALPLTLLVLLQNMGSVGSGVERTGSISLYMAEHELPALHNLVANLKKRDDIENVTLITPAQALAEFERESGFGEALGGLDSNPLPPVIEVVPAVTEQAALNDLLNFLKSQNGVTEAQLDQAWVARLHALLSFAERLALLLTVLLASGVILVIGNTVRLAIENRRAEIVVVKLVGGTDSYVARPFLYTGLWYGVGGALLGCTLLQLGLWALAGPLAQFFTSYDDSFHFNRPGLTGCFLVVVVAALLGWLGALLSVLRHLRAIEPR
jgi:cell division transport system permease protein